jgi:hypothetical protein
MPPTVSSDVLGETHLVSPQDALIAFGKEPILLVGLNANEAGSAKICDDDGFRLYTCFQKQVGQLLVIINISDYDGTQKAVLEIVRSLRVEIILEWHRTTPRVIAREEVGVAGTDNQNRSGLLPSPTHQIRNPR